MATGAGSKSVVHLLSWDDDLQLVILEYLDVIPF